MADPIMSQNDRIRRRAANGEALLWIATTEKLDLRIVQLVVATADYDRCSLKGRKPEEKLQEAERRVDIYAEHVHTQMARSRHAWDWEPIPYLPRVTA